MDQLWPDTAVEENNLTVIISALRKTLGEDHEQHQYIVTIPGTGYRFVAEVIGSSEQPATKNATTVLVEKPKSHDALARTSTSRKPGILVGAVLLLLMAIPLTYWAMKGWPTAKANAAQSIAVLPFQSAGFGSDDEYLALGMADALVARLRNVRNLFVRRTEDVLAYRDSKYEPREAGRALGVSAVVVGSVHKFDSDINVQVKVVRVSDAVVLWSAEFKGGINELLAIQNQISEQIASAVTRTPRTEEKQKIAVRYSRDPEAYQLYLHGQYFLTHRSRSGAEYDLNKAVTYFQQAVDKDEHFALAYAGLADAYNKLSWYLSAEDSYAKAEAAAQKAVTLDPDLPTAYRFLAVAKQGYEWDLNAADTAYRRSIELDPDDSITHRWHADVLLAMGRNQEAAEEWRRSNQLDPYSTVYDTLGRIYFFSRQYRDAFFEMQGKQDVDPDVFWYTAWIYGLHQNDLGGLAPKQVSAPMRADRQLTNCELAYANIGRASKEGIKSCLSSLQEGAATPDTSPYKIALLYVAIKDKDSAFYWLDRARQAHTWDLSYVKVDPRLDDLRADARFNDLLKRMGLNR